jgi:hypothetical protein
MMSVAYEQIADFFIIFSGLSQPSHSQDSFKLLYVMVRGDEMPLPGSKFSLQTFGLSNVSPPCAGWK